MRVSFSKYKYIEVVALGFNIEYSPRWYKSHAYKQLNITLSIWCYDLTVNVLNVGQRV